MSSCERLGNPGMPPCGLPFLITGPISSPFFIVEDDDGADEIGSLGAAGVGAVTSAAVLCVEGLAFFGRGRIGLGAESQKLAGAARSPCAAASTSPAPSAALRAAAPGGRAVLLRVQGAVSQRHGRARLRESNGCNVSTDPPGSAGMHSANLRVSLSHLRGVSGEKRRAPEGDESSGAGANLDEFGAAR